MKLAFNIVLFFLIHSSAYGQQFYIRGEVKDESGNPLQNVNILHHGSGYLYRSGSYGSFGIVTQKQVDTLTFSADGYQKKRLVVSADNYVSVQLKRVPTISSNPRRDKLTSLTENLARETQRQWFVGDESYASLIENRFINTEKYPSTTLSLNIDRASYSNIRRFLNMNAMVPPDAVRIEEMLNYFNVNYSEPPEGQMFKVSSVLTSCPWNSSNQLLFINASSKKVNLDTLPPGNFVFLIDVSGSMDMPNRLPLLKSAFRLLVNNLREKDTVSIVVYGGAVGVMLHPTGGKEKEKIFKAIDELTPGGYTPGESGIRMAYTLARNHFIKGGNNRVILATDGDFNVGSKTETELEELITQQRESGIYLTCIGVGMGNYKESKIQTLAKKGNGNYAYFDSFKEAEKILLTEFTQTLYAVADDVQLNMSFNPLLVNEYRLIGFDNKVGAITDSLSVIEGGEIGSGYSVMVVFEIEPTLVNTDAIYEGGDRKHIAELQLNYKSAGSHESGKFIYKAPFRFTSFYEIEKCFRFSSAVIMFGSLLKGSPFAKNMSWQETLSIAMESAWTEDASQQEFIAMVQQAKMMYSRQKKKKKDAGGSN